LIIYKINTYTIGLKLIKFKKDKFVIVKKALPLDLAQFIFHYIMLKREVAKHLKSKNKLNEDEGLFGTWKDQQVPNTYSHYADIVMETLLVDMMPTMEKHTGMKLFPNYSYTRIYKYGDILAKHTDRKSCEISTTLNLGGEKWPIFLRDKKKTHKVNLNPGDMLIYKGCILEHWREPFKGMHCAQVFLHYNNARKKNAIKFDNRKHVGLPYEG